MGDSEKKPPSQPAASGKPSEMIKHLYFSSPGNVANTGFNTNEKGKQKSGAIIADTPFSGYANTGNNTNRGDYQETGRVEFGKPKGGGS